MYRCMRQLQTLEALVSDFPSITLRQQRAQRFFQHYRQFSTRPSVRRVETVQVTHTDDAFIPFDTVKPDRTAPRASPVGAAGDTTVQREDSGQDEWHAEIELVPQAARKEEFDHAGAELELFPSGKRINGVEQPDEIRTVDSIDLQNLHLPRLAVQPDVVPPVLVPEPVPATSPASRKSRTDSRKERKLRRIEAGRYRLTADTSSKQDTEADQIQTVLAKLDELDGGETLSSTAPLVQKPSAPTLKDSNTSREKSKKAETPKQDKLLPKPKKERWQVQKAALEYKFGEAGWQPRKRLSPDTLEGIRALHASDPAAYSTETLSEHFKITPEAIRRILRSKWRPNDHEAEDRKNRWERRGAKKWQDMAEQGMRPPAKWRAMGVGSADGPSEEKIPKRRRRRNDDGLPWDDLVGGAGSGGELAETSLAERIL